MPPYMKCGMIILTGIFEKQKSVKDDFFVKNIFNPCKKGCFFAKMIYSIL